LRRLLVELGSVDLGHESPPALQRRREYNRRVREVVEVSWTEEDS
jgi:hypothetical protein